MVSMARRQAARHAVFAWMVAVGSLAVGSLAENTMTVGMVKKKWWGA